MLYLMLWQVGRGQTGPWRPSDLSDEGVAFALISPSSTTLLEVFIVYSFIWLQRVLAAALGIFKLHCNMKNL